MNEAWAPPASLTDFADLDHDRAARRGYPEAIYCEGKSPDQVAVIAAAVRERGTTTLFTRATTAHAKAILMVIPDAHHDDQAHLLAWPAQPPQPNGGLVLVVTAGTSDLPVAREALNTARYLGRRAELVVDVGVAGLHRVLGKLDLLRQARCLVVVAGMDGALPGLVAGLVAAPVVAVPTSVGYGAAFSGLAPLLTMLNACARQDRVHRALHRRQGRASIHQGPEQHVARDTRRSVNPRHTPSGQHGVILSTTWVHTVRRGTGKSSAAERPFNSRQHALVAF